MVYLGTNYEWTGRIYIPELHELESEVSGDIGTLEDMTPGLPQSFSQLSVSSPHPPKDITFKDVLVGFSLWHLLGAVFKRQLSS